MRPPVLLQNSSLPSCSCTRIEGHTYRVSACRRKSIAAPARGRIACRRVLCSASPENKTEDEKRQDAGPRPSISDPVQTISWGGRLPSRRRVLTSTLTATAIALISNLGGSTSALLGLLPRSFTRSFRLDVLYPRGGYKRCFDPQNGFEFDYPAKWLADQRLLQRYAMRLEQQNSLDPQPVQKPRQRKVAEPAAAFGPAGSTGEQNLSVIVAPVKKGFELQSLGQPREAAQRFLDTTIAPLGTDLKAELIDAAERVVDSEVYYQMEYTVKRPTFFRHNLSVYAVRNGMLYTLNAQCPADSWPGSQAQLRHAAESFRVMDAGPGLLDYPSRLR